MNLTACTRAVPGVDTARLAIEASSWSPRIRDARGEHLRICRCHDVLKRASDQ